MEPEIEKIYFTSREVAGELGISRQLLRFRVNKLLLPYRGSVHKRKFTVSDIAKLKTIIK